jgi:predicted amidohydrolase
MKLEIATSQFPVSDDIGRNLRYILRHIERAAQAGAQVVHFCEGALSGYAGVDFESFAGFDWKALDVASRAVLNAAARCGVWVLLGSSHRLSGRKKPHNCVYVIDKRGNIVDRYDKRFCGGDPSGKVGDLAHYTPGDHFTSFRVGGLECGVLVCHDYRYPELYREYKRASVSVMFHSFHAANVNKATLRMMQGQVGQRFHSLNSGDTLPEITMPAVMQASAATSHVWISCSNSSARTSLWPAFFVRADGVVTGRLRRHVPGILVSEIDTTEPIYDSTRHWRGRAMRGTYNTGTTTRDPRSVNRKAL